MKGNFPSVPGFLLALAAAALAADPNGTILERDRALIPITGSQVPKATAALMEQAEKIAGGTVFFYSRTPVQVGLHDIDWSGGHIHHQEWPAQLNRFFHLRTLASAYRATHDERFARAARAYIEDWLRGDPYPNARTTRPGDNTLTMSIRLGTSVQPGWGGTLPVFLASPAFDHAFVARMLDSMSRQADFLAAHLTPTGNWRISELDALIFTALRFPFLPNARKLLESSVPLMHDALVTQFLPDGVHVERTPGYADWMTHVAANYYQLARLFPEADARVNPDTAVRALDYAAQSELSGVNDSTAPHRDPSSLAQLAARAGLLQRMGIQRPDPPLEQVFPRAGQVFLRSAWKPGADYLSFDAGTWGGGHNHLSRLSFAFRSRGRMLVADPGILNYEMSDPLGPYGKSTPAHTTLNLDGANQSGADAQLLDTSFTSDAALIHARYQGAYWQGPYNWGFSKGRGTGIWGDHERILFWVKGGYILVLDAMSADSGHEVRNVWQLGPMDHWSQDPREFAWWSENSDMNLLLQLLTPPAKAAMQCFEGSRDPIRGWIGWHGNDAVPAPQVEFRYPSSRMALTAVLLAPYSGAARPRFSVKDRRDTSRGNLHHLELSVPDGAADHIAWSTDLALPVDDGEPFVTDATFVWRRTDASGRIVQQFEYRKAPQ